VLNCKRFVLELTLKNGGIRDFELAALNEHAWDESVDFTALVCDEKVIRCSLKALTQSHKVFACFWSEICEQFENYLHWFALQLQIHERVLSGPRLIDCFLVLLQRKRFVEGAPEVVLNSEVVEGPLSKLICVTDVLGTVQDDNAFMAGMFIEDAFEFVSSVDEELMPLGLKED
jgi:hypothetical protein